ncbi:hypothetical protein LTR59_014300 [Friedmanniomyces endolithicus]|nr:hypothetical protein LTR94_005770 [Friedmanniomyces endolithicus]KAK0776108.1 hypothetical protein LTR59_014300 [Friedmanniomyces endolithicus]KAK0777386.1 hypothetical protein LTR38_015186 [Friedmanniomyces endolithicus]
MPSFAIEVPGEANPLNEDLLVRTLHSAASSDPHQIQTGTKQLQQWERTDGYYKHLQSAYIDTRLPVELRYLAIIQLKNGIDKYWRKTATNAVSKDDKDAIRSRLIQSSLQESEDGLALQEALVIAKIARFEYPNDWPDALSALVQTLRSQVPPLQLARALLALLHIVKELSTARLQRSRQNLQAATPEIVHVLSTLYTESVAYWLPRLGEDVDHETAAAMRLSLMAMKVLRRLIITGYEHPNRHEEVVAVWSATQQHLQRFLQQSETEKLALQLAKLHHEMAREHPAAFALLPNSIDLALAYWGLTKAYGESFGAHGTVQAAVSNAKVGTDGDSDEKSTTEKLALRGLLILRACVKILHSPAQTFKHRSPSDKAEKSQATALIREQLLTPHLVQDMTETLITRFFVFRASDLRDWEAEPEEWEKREEGLGEDWEFSLRSCAEKLFLDLAINYKDLLMQPLLRVFYSVATPGCEDVLFKDSVYTAIGLAAPVVFEELDFDAFIRDVLVVEVQKRGAGWNVLRRRVAILLGQWISVRVSERRPVYQIFEFLLGRGDPLNDQVVRVTAGRQLSRVVDDWGTKAEELEPCLGSILTSLMALIDEVELTETKMALLNTISVIVERMEHRIAPFAEKIVGMLPQLWEASGEEHLMKQAILTILARLVNAMKADSVPLHGMVLPIIRGAVVPGSETEPYLLEDALDLWASLLVQTPSPSQETLDLIPLLFPIYDHGSEDLRKALEITESYLLLAPAHLLSDSVRPPLFAALASLFGALKGKPEANGMVCNIIELAIRQAHRLGGAAAVEQTASDLVAVGFLPKLLEGLRGSWTAHCTTGPRAVHAPVDGVVETDYLAIVARLILGSLEGFGNAVQASAPQVPTSQGSGRTSLEGTMQWLLQEWFSHLENIGDPGRRKLMALALTRLLNLPQQQQRFVLGHLQSLMTMWTDVITELRDPNIEETTSTLEARRGDSLVYSAQLAAVDPHEAPEDARRREMMYSDEVHTLGLPGFVTEALGRAVAGQGGMEAFRREWVGDVDVDVLRGFMGLGVM